MTLYLNNGRISLQGNKLNVTNLTIPQAQNLLLKLEFDKDCLFEALASMEEEGWNVGLLGMCGSFIYGEYKGPVQ